MPNTSSNVTGDPADVPKTSANVHEDSDDQFGWFRPAEVVYHCHELNNFGEAPTMEEVIHRPKQMAARWCNVRGVCNQCGFVAGCGTVDAIHAVRLLIEKHREKQKPVHIAFLDLEKAFDRVPREVIWYALRQHGVPEELIEWVRILYSCPKSRVQAAAGTSMEFPISVGVHQGSALSPLLFVVVMDAITRDLQKPVSWTLLYADDVMLASEDKGELERELQAWCDRLERFGLRLNVKKTEYLTTDVTESSSIKVNGIELPRTAVFKYLGSTVASDGKLVVEVNSRVSAARTKWRSLTGVLCDRKIPERLKSKIYRIVVRPVAMYGAECWPATKEVETRLSVMETKMLRWTAGVTRMDRIRNDAIRQKFGVERRVFSKQAITQKDH
ncbi:unnamed protein product [Heligmosomoides polygyrus]|uniref:Reverse transcriptase domain-containing protein n=1 Tax=Heligmosomoides polygyrus TaxID=6339 RepID=A0A183G526_HELPZ|nr:unnamed protein product [Heligmosomoides polygyrus]